MLDSRLANQKLPKRRVVRSLSDSRSVSIAEGFGGGIGLFFACSHLDQEIAHHPRVLVLEVVAVVDEKPRISLEAHAEADSLAG